MYACVSCFPGPVIHHSDRHFHGSLEHTSADASLSQPSVLQLRPSSHQEDPMVSSLTPRHSQPAVGGVVSAELQADAVAVSRPVVAESGLRDGEQDYLDEADSGDGYDEWLMEDGVVGSFEDTWEGEDGGSFARPGQRDLEFKLRPLHDSTPVPRVQQVTVQHSDLFEQLDLNQDNLIETEEVQAVSCGVGGTRHVVSCFLP